MESTCKDQQCEVNTCNNLAKYECPRCAFKYCSAPCYQRHSDICVKAFSEDSKQVLRGVYATKEERKNFQAIIERIRNNDAFQLEQHLTSSPAETQHDEQEEIDKEEQDGDDDNENPAALLQEMMSKLDDNAKDALFTILHTAMEHTQLELPKVSDDIQTENKQFTRNRDKATEEQKDEEIADVLESITDDMESCNLSAEEIYERLPVSLQADFENALKKQRLHRLVKLWIPWWLNPNNENTRDDSPPPPIPSVSQLGINPEHVAQYAHKNIVLTVIDVICAYCYTMRLCNGDWNADVIHGAKSIWQKATSLARDTNISGISEIAKDDAMGIGILEDVETILIHGDGFVSRVLGNALEICKTAVEKLPKGESKKFGKRAVKKLIFVTAWTLAQDHDKWISLAREVLKEIRRREGKDNQIRIAKQVGEEIRQLEKTVPKTNDGMHPGIRLLQ